MLNIKQRIKFEWGVERLSVLFQATIFNPLAGA